MNDNPTLKQILSDLIAFYPVSSNQKNVHELLVYVQKTLTKIGLESEILANNDVYMLYASTANQKTAKIMLQSHVDVVPAKDELRKARVSKGKLYGRGARDMLFATAAYLKFFYDHKKNLDNLDISLFLNGDEEVGSDNTTPWLLKQGYSADVVWLSDAGSKLDDLVVKAKGGFNFDLIVKGVAHHGSRPWEGNNAINKLLKLLTELLAKFEPPSIDTTTCTITQLESGDSINKGPDTARAHIDIRYINQKELKKYQSIINSLCKKFDGEIQNILLIPDYSVDTNSDIIKQYIKINESITGQKVNKIPATGSSDARYFSQENIPVIMTRPISHGSHSDNEWIDLKSYQEYYKVMSKYIVDVATISK